MGERPMLNFISHNESASRTILLIHGAYSSLEEWTMVCNRLTAYHLLIPDLPGHGTKSSAGLPFSVAGSADLLAELISSSAHNGRADLVGLSLGGYVGLNLASRYPDLVDSVFVSGCHLSWVGPWRSRIMGHVVATSIVLTFGLLPKSWLMYWTKSKGMRMSDAQYRDIVARCQYGLGVRVGMSIGEDSPPSILENVKARTAMVIGGNEIGGGELADRVKMLRKGNMHSQGFKVDGMEHAWNLQDPILFALGIIDWIEREEMPPKYVVTENEEEA